MIRQGDVLLVEIDCVPKGCEPKDRVLAYGEVTGHKHQFVDETTQVLVSPRGTQYVIVIEDAELVHEEHATVPVPVGNYEVREQRELDLLGEIRRVMD